MKYLFLIDGVESENKETLEILTAPRKEGDEVVVLCLSTLSSLSLGREGIPHVTPDLFFSKAKSPVIDKQAYAISRDWFKSLDPQVMSYRGVSIGAALEYDFYHLLVDALRSVEIASTILDYSFDVVYLPSSDPSIGDQAISFQTACYETLPPIISDLARKSGVKVARLSPSPDRPPVRSRRYRPKRDQGFVTSNALFLLKNRRDLPSLLLHRSLARIALVACPICQDAIINCLRCTDARGVRTFPGLLQNRRSKAYSHRLLGLLRDERTISKLDDEIAYEGNHFWRALYPLVDEVLTRLVPLLVGRISWTEYFVKMFKPASFAVFQDIMPLSRSMCQVLKNHGVRIVLIQHGILTNDMAGMYILPKVGDVQAVWGEYYKRWHVERGKSPDSQVVTRFPRHDKLVDTPPLDREELCRRFGLNPDRKVVLIATEWYQPVSSRYTIEQHEGFIRGVLRSLRDHDNIQVIVKLHPSCQSKYERIVSETAAQEGVHVVIAKDSLWELIRISSFVVVSLSSVCLEALILGRPVISVNMSDGTDISGLVQDGLAIGAYNRDGLDRAVRSCIEAPEQCVAPDVKREELLLPFTGPLDGQAARRVAELIGEISTRRRG